MAYVKEDIFKQAKEIAENEGYCFSADVIAELGIATSTFYDYFPADSEESESLKAIFRKNKSKEKIKLRKKWSKSDNATLNIAYYKLLADEEEFSRLARSEIDHTSKDKPISIPPIAWVDDEDESDQD